MAGDADFSGWRALLAGEASLDDVLVGLLGEEAGPGGVHIHRHARYAQEAGLLCWDSAGWDLGGLVKVADYAKDEYWGERVLLVTGFAPSSTRGFSWERRQSALVEISPAWSTPSARSALRGMDDADAERLCSLISRAWLSRQQAAAIEDSASEAKAGKSATPRI